MTKLEIINRKVEAEKKVVRDAKEAIEKKKRYEGNDEHLYFWSKINYIQNISEEMRALEELSRPSQKAIVWTKIEINKISV